MYQQQNVWNWKAIRWVNHLCMLRKTMDLKLIPEKPLLRWETTWTTDQLGQVFVSFF